MNSKPDTSDRADSRSISEETFPREQTTMNVEDIIHDYLDEADWRVNENSNIGFSFSGLQQHIAGTAIANYILDNVYSKEIGELHRNGDFHIHDLSQGIVGYCAGWSLRQLLSEGFNGVEGKIASGPPTHLSSALGQILNFFGTLQNEWAGAMAFSSFDTYLAPYVREDNLSYGEVKQLIQEFVFGLNVSSRWGNQTPFTNLTFDLVAPWDLEDDSPDIGGKIMDYEYKECQKEMDMINKAFIEVMSAGDRDGRPFTFPIPTYNMTPEFDWDGEISNLIFDMAAKYGLPYFQNFLNSDLKPSDVRSMCCRLQLDLRELEKKTGGLFGAGESTGSIGVVTMNLPRIGFVSKTEEEFMERLSYLMEKAKDSLETKRVEVTKNLEMGLMPYTKRYLGTMDHHFSTIGLIGMNEACENLLGVNIADEKGHEFAQRVLDHMRSEIVGFQEETKNIYNLEATPAEGTSYRLAKKDTSLYPGIITQGDVTPYYTNSSLLPPGYTDDIIFALKHQEELQRKYTGGTVLHVYIAERLSSGEGAKAFVRKALTKVKIPYISITPTYSICKEHNYIAGEHFICPTCGGPTEVFSRVTGYFRPVQHWNEGKRSEFVDRQEYHVD